MMLRMSLKIPGLVALTVNLIVAAGGAQQAPAPPQDTLSDGPGNREAVRQHVSLAIAPGGIAQNAEPRVADEPDRLDGFADQQ